MIEFDVVYYGKSAPLIWCGFTSLDDAKKQFEKVVNKYPNDRVDIIKANKVDGYHYQDTREVVVSTLHEQLSLFEV